MARFFWTLVFFADGDSDRSGCVVWALVLTALVVGASLGAGLLLLGPGR